VIGIQTVYPKGYKGKTSRSIEFTYGTFFMSEGNFKYKAIKQKLVVSKRHSFDSCVQYNKTIFDLQDIYGVEQ
jgi:hypothetical protein